MTRAVANPGEIALKLGTWAQLQTDAVWVRGRVFVDEQGIDPQDEWDEADANAIHCVAYWQRQAIATGRLLPDASLGRMAVVAEHRRHGIASRVLQALMHAGFRRGVSRFELSSQLRAAGLYSKHGFRFVGDPYLEVGIEHRRMVFEATVAERQIKRAENIRLHEVSWIAAQEPSRPELPMRLTSKALSSNTLLSGSSSDLSLAVRGIYLLHGLGEHSRRYDAIARWLTTLGWQVRAHDHRGHGRSDGRRGVLLRSQDFLDDASQQINDFAAHLGSAPLLLGHSMGGAMAAELVITRAVTVCGLVLSSPALALGLKLPQRGLLQVMNRLAPTLAVANGINPQYVSHDLDEVAAYRRDPLVHNKVCAGLVTWLLTSGERSRSNAASLSVPTLLLAAGSDRLVDPQGSREFVERAGLSHLTTRWYESAYHELFNEAEPLRLRIVNDLGDWLAHHFNGPNRSK